MATPWVLEYNVAILIHVHLDRWAKTRPLIACENSGDSQQPTNVHRLHNLFKQTNKVLFKHAIRLFPLLARLIFFCTSPNKIYNPFLMIQSCFFFSKLRNGYYSVLNFLKKKQHDFSCHNYKFFMTQMLY